MDECSKDLMKNLNITQKSIDDCILYSFGGDKFFELADNTILARHFQSMLDHGVTAWPSVIINENLYQVRKFFMLHKFSCFSLFQVFPIFF